MAEERKSSLTPEEQRKLIIVEFTGGDRDGAMFRSDSENPQEVRECMGYYIWLSQGGKIGAGICGMSTAAIQELREIIENTPEGPRLKRPPRFGSDHVYRVTHREENDETIIVRYTYQGRESAKK
jgi:hypothetical protein